MSCKFDSFSGNTNIVYRAFENYFEGRGNSMTINHTVNSINMITDSGTDFEYLLEDKGIYKRIKTLLKHGATVLMYGNSQYLATSNSSANIDLLAIKLEDNYLRVLGFNKGKSSKVFDNQEIYEGNDSLLDQLEYILECDSYTLESDSYFGMFGVTSNNFFITTTEFRTIPNGWYLQNDNVELPTLTGQKEIAVQNSTNNSETGEVKMSKVNNIVTANKNAAVSVAKIEAGRIAVKQAVKLVKPAVPVMARGYLETALGELVVANLFKFAVDNFAANNTKAKVVADAMLEGAMLGAIQSLNVEQMISDVLDKVDISKFTEITNSGE